MSLIGIISSDTGINEIIQTEFENAQNGDYILNFLADKKAILEFLNFDLPEIVIINFFDKNIDLGGILENIKSDTWLHNFGIVGLYDSEHQNEDELLKNLKDINVLVMLDPPRLPSHIVKCVQIIEQNRQIIFHRELSDKLVDRLTGSFLIDNDALAVSVYAGIAATTLAHRGYINPEAKMHLQLCLAELIINGIEHGNCGINFEEKSAYLEKGLSIVDLIAEKALDPAISKKRVFFEWETEEDKTRFVIRDEGDGFDVLKLKEKIVREGPMALHGRGIRMARALAHKLFYNKKGNEVILIARHESTASKKTPVGFSGEEVLLTKKGDIIFEEGEASNFLYYISSGKFNVLHQARVVGILGPEDIFMGEMSFLLNNRRSATVQAENPGKLVKISRKSFINVVKEYPHYGIFLSKLLARKLVRANIQNAAQEI
ncbi:MAG: cyclic nucleotide-binding domain-containing protein [Spirochaetota bacterium]